MVMGEFPSVVIVPQGDPVSTKPVILGVSERSSCCLFEREVGSL